MFLECFLSAKKNYEEIQVGNCNGGIKTRTTGDYYVDIILPNAKKIGYTSVLDTIAVLMVEKTDAVITVDTTITNVASKMRI